MQKWEYKVINYQDFNSELHSDDRAKELESLLNQAGEEGYRVVPIYIGSYGCVALMEREKKEEVPEKPKQEEKLQENSVRENPVRFSDIDMERTSDNILGDFGKD